MEKETVLSGIMFATENLEKQGYAFIDSPGTYTLEVASTVTEKNLVKNSGGNGESYIVGFKAIAEDKKAQVLEVFTGKNEVPIEMTQGLFLTGNLWKNAGLKRLPIKGEKVDVVIDHVSTREDKEVMVLRVKTMNLRPVSEAKKMTIQSFFSGAAPSNGEVIKNEKEHAIA
jgi:hypothetical protein